MTEQNWRPRVVDVDEWTALTDGATTLSEEAGKWRLLATLDGRHTRVFPARHMMPCRQAQRFARHADRLLSIDASCVLPLETLCCRSLGYQAVQYQPLSGRELQSPLLNSDATKAIAATLAFLHDRGIYVRGLCLQGLLLQENSVVGLTNTSSVVWWPMPLPRRLRQKQLYQLLVQMGLLDEQADGFLNQYFASSLLGWWRAEGIRKRLMANQRFHQIT